VKALLPKTYNQAKQLALIVEAQMKDSNELSKLEINKIENFLVTNDKTINDDPDHTDIETYNNSCETISDCYQNGIDIKIDKFGEVKSYNVDALDHCDKAEVDKDK
ncbi:19756_t:CDS:2, partial [Gigaspora margarita]